MLFMCITGTLFPSTGHRSFEWAGPAWLADSPLLTNQMAFTKCVSYYLNVPAPTDLSIVFNSPLHHLIFPRLVYDRVCDIITQCHAFQPKFFWDGFANGSCYLTQFFQFRSSWNPILPQDLLFKAQDSFLFGGMCHRKHFQPPDARGLWVLAHAIQLFFVYFWLFIWLFLFFFF